MELVKLYQSFHFLNREHRLLFEAGGNPEAAASTEESDDAAPDRLDAALDEAADAVGDEVIMITAQNGAQATSQTIVDDPTFVAADLQS